jgi:integrase
MHPGTLSGLFVRQAGRAGLPAIRLHDLWHSVASILLARGVHPKVVSDMLGHATIALTLEPTATSSRRSSRKRRML